MLLTKEQIESLSRESEAASSSANQDEAWSRLQPLLLAQSKQRDAAEALLNIVEKGFLTSDRNLELFEAVESAHPEDEGLLCRIGEHLAQAIDINFLNAPPLTTGLAPRLLGKLQMMVRTKRDSPDEVQALDALSSAARISGRRYDLVAENAYRRLIELEPGVNRHHYNYGLFLKTRGRFAEGMAVNQLARDLSEKVVDRYEWNLGICATGAGEPEVALQVWKAMGQNLEIGRFDLPDGSYPSCKVRLAERPLAERSADVDTPGEEETIWIERLSPCHGIIRSVLYQNLGVDYGDVILIDGAPVTYHNYGEEKIPVFPHLATLIRQNYRLFDFAGTQSVSRQVHKISEKLEGDSVIYSHSENTEILCMDCWLDKEKDHAHTRSKEANVVKGRIAVHPNKNLIGLLREIDDARPCDEACRIFSPDLCEAAGLTERAKFERRRFDQLLRT